MRQLIKTVLHRLPYIRRLHEQVKNQGAFPAGHYHSPIPCSDDVVRYFESREPIHRELPDIELNKESQFQRLQDYQRFYAELPFPEKQSQDFRYYYNQNWFCYADAIFLYSFLRQTRPKRIVEVGSGFSSAVILDTRERFLPQQTEVTFIEPYPDRLISLLKDHDKKSHRIIKAKVQEVPFEILTSLGSGDLLFVDSSHVVKCGSDVLFIVFDVLPKLPSGVFVHFHDIFYPFEYSPETLAEGFYWNEIYFLRAFLAYNREWSIYFFNHYIGSVFEEFIKNTMPLCLKNPGGSLYIQRI